AGRRRRGGHPRPGAAGRPSADLEARAHPVGVVALLGAVGLGLQDVAEQHVAAGSQREGAGAVLLGGNGSISPTNAPLGSFSSSTVPSAASGSLAGSSARTTTSSWASAPVLSASRVTVPAGTSARAGATDHSLSSTAMVASLEPA